MNNDDDRISPQPSNDQALEARIVAWVMGEASAFESAELSRIIAERPVLAAFKTRIEATHRLLREAAAPEKTPLKMSGGRRAKLLATLGIQETLTAADEPSLAGTDGKVISARETGSTAAEKKATKKSDVLAYPMARSRGKTTGWIRGMAIACSLMLTFVVLHVTVFAPRPFASSAGIAGDPHAELPATQRVHVRNELKAKNELSMRQSLALREAEEKDAEEKQHANRDEAPRTEVSGESAEGDKVVNLAPFEVTADSEYGYSASNTLAGTRIQTEISLPNIDSQIERHSKGSGGKPSSAKADEKNRPGFSKRISALADDAPMPAATENANETFDPVSLDDSRDAISKKPELQVGATKDVASSVTIVNPDFLKDTGAANSGATMQYERPIAVSSGQGVVLFGVASPSPFTTQQPSPATSFKQSSGENMHWLGEQSAQTQPVSTFSLHVSDVSFRLAADALAAGEKPAPDTIRPEEFYNAFDYGDPAPAQGEPVACRIEQAAHPTKQQRNLLRIALRVPSTGRSTTQPLRLTILLDTSGSMQRRDRAATVKGAIASLVSLLRENDQVTLIGFARTPRLLAENVSGADAQKLISIIEKTPAEGGTNLDAALALGGELAKRQQLSNAVNRIVLITDGAANLGNADPKKLSAQIETLRQQGIAFDACGVGTSGVDDAMLETLTRHGDGRYLLLDHSSAADEFAKQLAGAFRPAAKNVKVQVRFNPNRVAHYRLLGFAQHRLKEEDFRNDKVDAAELAADEAGNALYEVEPLPRGDGALGEVYVRFQDVATGQMVERSWTLPYDANAPRFDRATLSLQLAGTAALIAEYLRGAPIKLDDLVGPVNQLRGHYRDEPRVQTLISMFDQLRRLDRRP